MAIKKNEKKTCQDVRQKTSKIKKKKKNIFAKHDAKIFGKKKTTTSSTEWFRCLIFNAGWLPDWMAVL